MTDESDQLAPSSTRAGIGGAGSGTGLVALAHAVGTDTTAGAIVLYLAPSASIIVGALLYFVEAQASRFFRDRLARKTRETLEGYLQNPHTSEKHKAEIRQRLEELESAIAAEELERIRLVTVTRSSAD